MTDLPPQPPQPADPPDPAPVADGAAPGPQAPPPAAADGQRRSDNRQRGTARSHRPRRPNGQQRHRSVFFARLTDLRGRDSEQAPVSESRRQARLAAAVQRVGGAQVVADALDAQLTDAQGQPLRWSAVCAARSEAHRPGDVVFDGWLRLAATPVRDVKAVLSTHAGGQQRDQRRRRGPDESGRGADGDRAAVREHGRDGRLRRRIDVPTLPADDRR